MSNLISIKAIGLDNVDFSKLRMREHYRIIRNDNGTFSCESCEEASKEDRDSVAKMYQICSLYGSLFVMQNVKGCVNKMNGLTICVGDQNFWQDLSDEFKNARQNSVRSYRDIACTGLIYPKVYFDDDKQKNIKKTIITDWDDNPMQLPEIGTESTFTITFNLLFFSGTFEQIIISCRRIIVH